MGEKKPKVKEIKPFDQMKYLFSSLFARQMNFIIVGADTEDERVLYFSNINLEEIDIYEQDASKFVHRVTIQNPAILEALYSICPLMKNHILYIDSRSLLSALSKEFKNDYSFEVTKTNALVLNTSKAHYVVGEMISAYIAGLYVELFHLGEVSEEDAYTKELTLDDVNLSQVFMIPAFNNKNQDLKAKAVLTPARNLISLKEDLAKANPDSWKLILKIFGDRVCKLQCDFISNDITVESTQPGMRFYCLKA